MTGESRKCACGRTYTLPLPYDAANPEIRDLCPGLGGVPPCVPAISTPAPEPDEKCEVCGNPLEYHNNAYRWCKNMHSFRYFQTPHTSTPAPDLHSVIMKTESEIAVDKLNEAAYTRGKIDGAKAAREQARQSIDVAIEQLSDINKYACEEYEEANLSDNEREMRIHLEYGNRVWGVVRSLRSQKEPQQ